MLETPGRNTVGECFDYMIQDLTDARPLLRQVAPDDPVYVSQTAVDALLARIYLYKKIMARLISMRMPFCNRSLLPLWVSIRIFGVIRVMQI